MRTKPSAVISFMDVTNVTTLIALSGAGVPVIVTEHSDPVTSPIRNRFWGILRRLTYPRAACVVSVSAGIDAFFGWMPAVKRAVIANPLPPDIPPASTDERRQIVAMGRFVPEKGFDLLIDAFALIAPDYPDWCLLIMGDGGLRDDLTAQIARHGLTDRVDMPGFAAQPFERLAESAFFVLSSRTEGFGNVMIEAMACGLPVVSFDCPASPREIITPDHDGYLVPPEDVVALADAFRRMIDHPDERRRLAVNARETSARYRLNAITARWYDLFDSVGVKRDMM
jgi:GalNAc-alpha-(1->4)-GalNAc-alpha-(1->3)-diNAcBac-PP-undecaprenol alpha-1,4-N-acetyl-D-galactosaminyltransferase